MADADVSILWRKVESFRREMLHERNDQDYFSGSSIWTSMTCPEKRDYALNAVQDTLLDQLESIIEVRSSRVNRGGFALGWEALNLPWYVSGKNKVNPKGTLCKDLKIRG